MTTQYTPILKLALPVTGELTGTWGDVVNDNITSMVEQAVAGLATINTWTTNSHTLTTANGTTSESRCAMLVAQNGAGLTGAGEIICPASSKLYVLKNDTSYTITLKTSAGTGVAVVAGNTAFLFCDGTNVNACVTTIVNGRVTGNLTVDGIISAANGTAGTPALNATADTNTGLYFPAADTLGLVTGGTERARVDSSGNLGVGTSSPSTYGGKLNVYAGDIVVADSSTSSGASAPRIGSNAQALVFKTNTGGGSASEVARFDGSGNLGIGTTGPGAKLEVAGTSTGATLEVLRVSNNGAGGNTQAQINFTSTATSYASIAGGYGASAPQMTFNLPSATAGNYVWQISSSERMRLDASGNLGIGTSSPGAKLQVGDGTSAVQSWVSGSNSGTGGGAFTAVRNGSSYVAALGNASAVLGGAYSASPVLYFNGGLQFSETGTERMRLDASGNLGIGTTSPASKLDVRGTDNTDSVRLSLASNTNGAYQGILFTAGIYAKAAIRAYSTGTTDAGSLTFWTSPAGDIPNLRATLDSSGNLGLGVTPSAWGGGFKVVETIGSALGSNTGNESYLFCNTYFDTAFKYKDSFAASYLQQSAGQFRFFNAPSGTAGNTISFTQAMTLNSSGSLVVGSTTANRAGANTGISAEGASTSILEANVNASRAGFLYSDAASTSLGEFRNFPLVFRTNDTERMRLDASGNLGIGTTSPSNYGKLAIQCNGLTQPAIGFIDTNTSGRTWLMGPGVGTGLATDFGFYDNTLGQIASVYTAGASGRWAWYTNYVERMRLDASGNLGLGVTPSAWGSAWKALQFGGNPVLAGNNIVAANNAYNNGTSWLYSTTNFASRYESNFNGGGIHAWFTAPSGTAGNAISFTQAMTLDASGNLGIGTSSPATTLHVQSATGQVRIQNTTSGTALIGFRNSVTTDIPWVGTGGDDLRFITLSTERMRLDSSGNLGLGVTPSAWGSNFKAIESAAASSFAIAGANINGISILSNAYADNSNWRYTTTGPASRYAINQNIHQWFTAPSGTAGNAISFTQAMTLDASGQLMVGTTAATARLTVENTVGADGLTVRSNGFNTNKTGVTNALLLGADYTNGLNYVVAGGSGTNTTLTFWTAATAAPAERARITSGGDLLVGTTSDAANVRTNITFNGATRNGLRLVNTDTSGTPYAFALSYPNYSPNNTNQIINFSDSSLTRFEFRANGGLANYQANDVNLSDRREKTNFAPAKSYLDTICAIPVQTFNYIDQPDDDPGLTLGVVAQDVQAVAPELVMESNWGTEDNPKMRLSIYQTDLQYALMKCIQEQQAIINDLRARVAALESN